MSAQALGKTVVTASLVSARAPTIADDGAPKDS